MYGFNVKGGYRFPATLAIIWEGLNRLRGNAKLEEPEQHVSQDGLDGHAESSSPSGTSQPSRRRHSSVEAKIFYRGMKNTKIKPEFLQPNGGGTHLGPLSTTSDLKVALKYSHQAGQTHGLIMKLLANTDVSLGINLESLTCFPGEME